jgi:hypothetical protein
LIDLKQKQKPVEIRRQLLISNLYQKIQKEISDYDSIDILTELELFNTTEYWSLTERGKPAIRSAFTKGERNTLSKIRKNPTRQLDTLETARFELAKRRLGLINSLIEEIQDRDDQGL